MYHPLHVLFMAAEATPFIKVGGLADVAGSLPRALNGLKKDQSGTPLLDVRLVIPMHPGINISGVKLKPIKSFQVKFKKKDILVKAFQANLDGVTVYFIDGEPISRSSLVYSTDLQQDQLKYGFFSIASLKLTRLLNWHVDILHANDWHTSLALFAIRSGFMQGFFHQTATLLTLHNLSYMGGDLGDLMIGFGLNRFAGGDLPDWSTNQALPLGLWAADAIVPVSGTYAREIRTPEFGCGLDGYLTHRGNDITGIINGLDTDYWDPAKDEFILRKYDLGSMELKRENKTHLQQTFDLPVDQEVPLLGMVTRLDPQKGVDLVTQALKRMGRLKWQFVILGIGDRSLESKLLGLKERFPNRIGLVFRFDNRLSHQIYAGADALLMPSRFEPCGLSQMIAMRFGTIPIVSRVGGLLDTVKDEETGFLMSEVNPESLTLVLRHALSLFKNKSIWNKMQKNAMRQELSWGRSALKYADIYLDLVNAIHHGGES